MGVRNNDRIFSINENEIAKDDEKTNEFTSFENKDLGETLVNPCALQTLPPTIILTSANFNSNNGTDLIGNKKQKTMTSSDDVIELDAGGANNPRKKTKRQDHFQDNLDLLLRPSYCDAAFALSQVKQVSK